MGLTTILLLDGPQKVELLLKTALGTKNLAQIQVGLFKADQMTMKSKVRT
jgi:hypothetical protein